MLRDLNRTRLARQLLLERTLAAFGSMTRKDVEHFTFLPVRQLEPAVERMRFSRPCLVRFVASSWRRASGSSAGSKKAHPRTPSWSTNPNFSLRLCGYNRLRIPVWVLLQQTTS